jgi:hypothetical protein
MLPNATLVQGDLKRKTSLPHGDIEQARQHCGGHQVRRTNNVKQLATPKGMQHVVIKQQNRKMKKKLKEETNQKMMLATIIKKFILS